MKRLISLVTVFAMALAFLPAALATAGNLPGGTSIEITIDDPADGDEFVIPPGDATVDIDVHGTASVGAGVPVQDTTVVYVLDVSGSMNNLSGVDCDGVGPTNDSRLLCEKVGVAAANAAAAAATSAVDLTGLASYAGSSTAHDVDLFTVGTQLLVAPGYDGNTNTVPDVEDVANGLGAGGATNYAAGLSAASTILNSPLNTNTVNVVIFMSDGGNNTGADVTTVLPLAPAATVNTFAIGTGVTCASDPTGRGSLQEVADLTGGTCTQVTDPSDLANAIGFSIGSTLDAVDVSVNGGAAVPADMTDDVLPANGPITTGWWHTVTLGPGVHEICGTATGTDAGGTGDVTMCIEVKVLQGVDIDIKPGSFPNSINVNKKKGVIPVAILGSDTFDVTTIDPATLEFAGASPRHNLLKNNVLARHLEDVNNDGYVDLVTHYRTQETNIAPGDTEACIMGNFGGGFMFVGCDSVRTVPPS